MGRRGFIEFIGGLGSGVLVGYYAGAKKLLGIQRRPRLSDTQQSGGSGEQKETTTPGGSGATTDTQVSTSTETDTPTPTPAETDGPADVTIFDDFEDTSQVGWTVEDGDPSILVFSNESVHGSKSLYFENAPNEVKLSKGFDQPIQIAEFSLWFKYRSQSDNNFRYMLRDQNENTLIEIREFFQTVHYKNEGGDGVTAQPVADISMDTWYRVTLSNIDFQSQTVDIAVANSDGEVVNAVREIGFRDTVDQINHVDVVNSLQRKDGPGGATDPLWLDYITYKT